MSRPILGKTLSRFVGGSHLLTVLWVLVAGSKASKAPPQTFPWTYLPHIPWNWRWTFSLESEIKLEMNMEQCASNATQLNLCYSWIRVTYWPEICFNKELFFTFMCKSESLRSWYVCKSESGTSWCEFAVSNENIAIISPIHCIFIGWWHKINVCTRFFSSFQALTKAFLLKVHKSIMEDEIIKINQKLTWSSLKPQEHKKLKQTHTQKPVGCRTGSLHTSLDICDHDICSFNLF